MNSNRSDTTKMSKHAMCEKLLGVKIDSQLSFNYQLETIIEKKTVRRYMFWLELRLICAFQKRIINEYFF